MIKARESISGRGQTASANGGLKRDGRVRMRARGKVKAGVRPTVFISYNQRSGGGFVDELEKALTDKADVRRDTNDIGAWGNIRNFMDTVREQDFAVIVITDEYLKSGSCLYEVMELMKDSNWADKTIYVVLNDPTIYRTEGRVEYVKYWNNKCKNLRQEIEEIDISATAEMSESLKEYEQIKNNIGEFLRQVSDTNNPSQYIAIKEIVERIEKRQKVC